jgi:hypothetical protein
MEFILGVFSAALFFCCLFLAYWMGQRQTKRPKRDNPLTEEEMKQREQIKKYNEHFKQLFNYDVGKALERKKVL